MKNREAFLKEEYSKEISMVALEMGQYACQCVDHAIKIESLVKGSMKELNFEIAQTGESLKTFQKVIDCNWESSQNIEYLIEFLR